MTEKHAIEMVEEEWGSIEEFALHILDDENEHIMDRNVSIVSRARDARVPPKVLNFILTQSISFRKLMRQAVTNDIFDVISEKKHVEAVAKAARGDGKREVMSPTGEVVQTSLPIETVMKAGDYINKYRSTPLDEPGHHHAPPLVVMFGATPTGQGPEVIDAEAVAFSPLQAGGLPPSGIRDRYGKAEVDTAERHALTREGAELDFYSGAAAEKARSKEKADAEEESRTAEGGERPRIGLKSF